MHNGVWTQSADKSSTGALDTAASYNSKQQPTRKSGYNRTQAEATAQRIPSGVHAMSSAGERSRTRHLSIVQLKTPTRK